MFSSYRLERYAAVCLAASLIIQRLTMAGGSGFYGLAIAVMIIILVKDKASFRITELQKEYLIPVCVFCLSIIPSVAFSTNVAVSLKEFLHFGIIGPLAIFVVLLGIRETTLIKGMFKYIFSFWCVECIVTLILFFMGDERIGGFGGSYLAFACVAGMFFAVLYVDANDNAVALLDKKYVIGIIVLTILALIANRSRGGWLTILILVPVLGGYYFAHSWKKLAVVLACLTVLVGCLSKAPYYEKRFESITNITTDRSNGDRVEAWKGGWKMFKDHPLTGVGLKNWKEVYLGKYRTKADTQGLNHAHNLFVQIATEDGAIGFCGYLYMMGTFFWINLKKLLLRFNPYRLMLLGQLLAFNLYGMTEYTLGLTMVARTMWFLTGALAILSEDYDSCKQESSSL